MIELTLRSKETLAAWSFLLPGFVGFCVFVFGAVIVSLILSFLQWDMLTQPRFVGLQNYATLFTKDKTFGLVLKNTIIFVLGTVPTRVILGLVFALILVRKIPLRVFFRAAVFFPVIVPTVAAAMVFRWIFNADFGLLNDFLYNLGVSNLPRWLSEPRWALIAIVILSVWKDVGFSTVLFMAGLEGIPSSLYEAAQLDGANSWKRFVYITMPLLSPTTFFVIVINVISSFQVFDQAYVLTGGGPGNATNTIVYYIYSNAFQWFKMGYASAIAWVLFGIIFLATLVQFRYQKKWVYYE
ncbi:carbohydrate ABC transporter permease [Pseudothermotoga sp. U03pept]|uniref:carbohydrate ABC transporter permease n=1 Tax=Pseudothermotoga sp. U03pept TaxID=3447012 RepID=UPI003F0D2D98